MNDLDAQLALMQHQVKIKEKRGASRAKKSREKARRKTSAKSAAGSDANVSQV